MTSNRKLSIVLPSVNDLSLGEVLLRTNQFEETNPSMIDAAFSLYFQWPDYGKAFMAPKGEPFSASVTLDYDHEEKALSSIRVRYIDHGKWRALKIEEPVEIRIEIFKQCFDFSSRVLFINNSKQNVYDIILDVPK